MEDIVEILIFVARTAPQMLDTEPMEGVVMFLIAFLASSSHIRNPYLRSKLAEVRHILCMHPCQRLACIPRRLWAAQPWLKTGHCARYVEHHSEKQAQLQATLLCVCACAALSCMLSWAMCFLLCCPCLTSRGLTRCCTTSCPSPSWSQTHSGGPSACWACPPPC